MKLLASHQVTALHKVEKGLTIRGSIENGLMINKAIQLFGEDLVVNTISAVINMTSRMFNVSNNITPPQSFMLSCDLIEKYPTENIEDFILMLKNIRTSGMKMYGKFDAETIFSEMDKYMDEKITEREAIYAEEKQKYQMAAPRSSEGQSLRENIRAAMIKRAREEAQ